MYLCSSFLKLDYELKNNDANPKDYSFGLPSVIESPEMQLLGQGINEDDSHESLDITALEILPFSFVVVKI